MLNSLEENEVIPIIEDSIKRNFGGIDYEVNIHFDSKLINKEEYHIKLYIKDKIKFLNDILSESKKKSSI